MNVGARFVGGRGLAEERGQEDENEQAGRERSEDDVESGRAERPLEPRGKRPPLGQALELRALPERAEEEKREHEHDGGAPREEPRRNRQVADTADPVGEDQGRTSRSAIWSPRSSSSISNRPGTCGPERMRARRAGRDVGHQVVAVQVDVVGDVGAHDEDDASALARSSRAGSATGCAARDDDPDRLRAVWAVAASSWSPEAARSGRRSSRQSSRERWLSPRSRSSSAGSSSS